MDRHARTTRATICGSTGTTSNKRWATCYGHWACRCEIKDAAVAAVLLRFRHAVRHDCGRHFGSFGAGAVRGGTLSPEQARAPGSLSEEHVFSAYRGQSAASAGIGQLRNSPHEWGQGVAGYAKR